MEKRFTVFLRGTMKNSAIIFAAIAAIFISVQAETHISGDIRSASLDASGNPYIIDQDIVVPAGKRLTIKEGCVLLFKGFTGINVSGHLTIAGTTKQPVIFTSINDGDYNTKSEQLPNPFDWNGILIAKESNGAVFQNFQLRYSVYGVKSQTTNVSIQSGIFRQNGQFHFTINDKIQYVQDNISFSYTGIAETTGSQQTTTKTGDQTAQPSSTSSAPVKQPESSGKLWLRYSSLGVGVVGVAVGSVCLALWLPKYNDTQLSTQNFQAKYHIADTDSKGLNAKWNEIKSQANGYALGTWIGYGLGILGLTGFTLTFVF